MQSNSEIFNFDEFKESEKFFKRIYDIIRYVDPIENKVYSYHRTDFLQTGAPCYHFWSTQKICDNCISQRACKEGTTYMKLEYASDRVYLISAIPVAHDNKIFSVELIKDVTSSMIITELNNNNEIEIHNFIENMNLLAMKDSLTQIYNRRFVSERFPADIIRYSKQNNTFTVIMADLDHFKNVNDKFGHVAGDVVLKRFSNILESCIRSSTDWVARYGGEEFLVFLGGADLSVGARVAERMRINLEKSTFSLNDNEFNVTASFGLCNATQLEDLSPENIIEYADKNLYKAKNSGRNKVIWY